MFTEDLLRELCLGLHSMCVGAESKFFNGHTNISDDRFIVFGVKGLMEANMKLKNAMLFNILSYMNHKLLTKGNTAASIDELYLFLDEHDGNRIYPQRFQACAKKRFLDSSGVSEYRGLFIARNQGDDKAPLFHSDASVPLQRRQCQSP